MKKTKRIVLLVLAVVVLLLAAYAGKTVLDLKNSAATEVQEEDSTRWAELTSDPLTLEGIADGSITTRYPRELSELLPILTSLWFIPHIYPATRAEQRRKFAFILDMLDAMGLPLRSPEVEAAVERFFSAWPEA